MERFPRKLLVTLCGNRIRRNVILIVSLQYWMGVLAWHGRLRHHVMYGVRCTVSRSRLIFLIVPKTSFLVHSVRLVIVQLICELSSGSIVLVNTFGENTACTAPVTCNGWFLIYIAYRDF